MLWHCLVWRAAAAHPYGTAPLIGSCACATAGDLLPARRGSQDTVPSICMRSCKCRRGTQWEVDPCGIWRQQTTHILLDLVFCWGNYKWIHCESEYQQGEEGPAAPPVQQHQMFNTSLLVMASVRCSSFNLTMKSSNKALRVLTNTCYYTMKFIGISSHSVAQSLASQCLEWLSHCTDAFVRLSARMPGLSQWYTNAIGVCTSMWYTQQLNKLLFIGIWKNLQLSHRNRNVIWSFKIPCFEDKE